MEKGIHQSLAKFTKKNNCRTAACNSIKKKHSDTDVFL